MKIATALPYAVNEIPHYWIAMPDGTRLAARLWLPETDDSVPAIFEYIPYRKSDMMAFSDATTYRYLAGHGFACVRVDVRGSGDSDGILADEYSAQELVDGCHIVEWIAARAWCNGRVGMTGISWGGFNALQVAARQPHGLAAVISCCSTDNRYKYDVHYLGGSVLASDMLGWASTLTALQSLPPDNRNLGNDWQAVWRQRLESLPHFVEPWLSHARYDDYWQHGSVCEDYRAIECPVLLVGGWADPYRNAIFSMLDNLACPTEALIGPWSHSWPHTAAPGPRIGYLQNAMQWWNHYLRDGETGPRSGPRIRYYSEDAPQENGSGERTGEWLSLSGRRARRPKVYRIKNGELSESRWRRSESMTVPVSLEHGEQAGAFCPMGHPDELPGEQSSDDARSLSLDSEALAEDVLLFGCPMLEIQTSQSAQLAARLCALAPDGKSHLLSRGFARTGPGLTEIEMSALGTRLKAGTRLRLALTVGYWPWIWPDANLEPVTVDSRRIVLELPVPHDPTALEVPFEEPEQARGIRVKVVDEGQTQREVKGQGDHITSRVASKRATVELESGVTMAGHSVDQYEINVTDPLTARVTCERNQQLTRGQWRITSQLESSMTADDCTFVVETQLTTFIGDSLFFTRQWQGRIKRNSQ